MFKKCYEIIGRWAYWLSLPLMRVLIGRASHRRVRLLVVSSDGKHIILQKSWFSKQLWSVPGGGIAQGESEETAGVRELAEETGLTVTEKQLQSLGTFRQTEVGFTAVAFVLRLEQLPMERKGIRRLEIIANQWFAIDALPAGVASTVTTILALYRQNKK